MNIRIDTHRFVVREFAEHDVAAMHRIHAIPEVVRYLTIDAHDEDAAREYVQGIIVSARETPRTVWDLAVTVKGADTMIGRVGMKRGEDPRIAMLWFTIAPEYQGQGVAVEAANALLGLAFDEVGLHRVWGDCDPRNPASARVMSKLGMRHEAHLIENVWIKGEWCDSLVFAMLRSEWVKRGGPARDLQ